MLNIVRFNLKKQLKSVVIYLTALIGFAWMYIGLFPSMQKIDIEAMMAQMPKEFQGFMGEEGAAAYNTIEGFLSGEYFSFFFILLIAFYVASVAGTAIAGASEKRTLDFDLAQPVTRTKRLLAETITAMFYSFLLVFITNLAIGLLCGAYDIDINGKGLLYLSIVATIFSWALYGIAILLSSISRSKIVVVGLTIFITLGSYIFYSLSLAVEKIKKYGEYTLYNYYDPSKILGKSELTTDQILVFVAIFAGGVLLATLIFNKKDA